MVSVSLNVIIDHITFIFKLSQYSIAGGGGFCFVVVTMFCFPGPGKTVCSVGRFPKLFIRHEGKELSGCDISLIAW